MRPIIALAAALLLAAAAQAQPALKPYLAIYSKGPAYDESKGLLQQKDLRAHGAHFQALGDRLVAAGPFVQQAEGLVGAIVILAPDLAAAEAWLAADPGVTSGVLAGEIREWNAPAIKPYARTP